MSSNEIIEQTIVTALSDVRPLEEEDDHVWAIEEEKDTSAIFHS